MRKTKKRAFTLIELLVTITIIGILAVGGIQVYTEQMKKARDTTNIKNLKIVDMGIQEYILDNGITIPIDTLTHIVDINERSRQIALNFKNMIRTYVPNIDDIKHSASKTSCASFANGCGFRYVVLENTDQYKVYYQLESNSKVCDGCITNLGQTEVWLFLGNNINLAGTMPGVRMIIFDRY